MLSWQEEELVRIANEEWLCSAMKFNIPPGSLHFQKSYTTFENRNENRNPSKVNQWMATANFMIF